MSDEIRKTGQNKLKRNGKLETSGRNEAGQREKHVSSPGRSDTYWGGKGRSDGPGHGHRNNETGWSRPPAPRA